jgi:hypothetical protein
MRRLKNNEDWRGDNESKRERTIIKRRRRLPRALVLKGI